MTQGVNRLKEILFDSESRRIEAIARDLEAQERTADETRREFIRSIAAVDAETQALKTAIGPRLDQVFEQAGTRQRLQSSVARILDGALREAEVQRHQQLSQAMAPLVIKTIKSEIVNSRDAMVEALYPITGRLVKAYVANAVKDMMADINRRLESGLSGRRLLLKLKSLATGRPMAELALAELQRLEIEELFLIRRGSGELIGHWEKAVTGGVPAKTTSAQEVSGRDAMVGNLLTAITSFAENAFEDDPESLRRLERETDCIYLRATPAYLLAARCAGTAASAVEQVVDNELLRSLDRHRTALAAFEANAGAKADGAGGRVLADLASKLELAVAEKQAELAPSRSGFAPLYAVAALVALPALAWLGWQTFTSYETNRVRDLVRAIVSSTSELRGYPIHTTVELRGKQITLTGLAPSQAFRDALVARVANAVPGSEVVDQLATLPSQTLPDYAPAIAATREEARRAVAEAESRMAALAQRSHEQLVQRIDGLARPAETPRQRLQNWTREHAIFFGNGIDYRSDQEAEGLLDAAASLIRAAADPIRVVGFTDERGPATRNVPLSLQRAEKVAAALVSRGVAKDRLIIIGRASGQDISPTTGPASPNRRAELEVGFTGETGQRP